jgi:hypothetical protein|uniref:hypothetical protein n=1 Tax=Clostridium sp. 12(A) TaxID=1163671 RepID=UPI00046780AB|nr:hypothetical protein [Clostridium sp. 12(A)]
MNKLYVKASVIFLLISTIFFPYYFSYNDKYERAFGFPYRYIFFNEMKVSFFLSMNIDLSLLLIDFVIIYVFIYFGVKIIKAIKKLIQHIKKL